MQATDTTARRSERRGVSQLNVVQGASDQELPDARITAGDRRFVRRLVALFEPVMSSEMLMFLAGGLEDAAWRKWAAERGSA